MCFLFGGKAVYALDKTVYAVVFRQIFADEVTVKYVYDCYQWDIHNKGSLGIPSSISTGHYLNVLVPVKKYGRTNPEFYLCCRDFELQQGFHFLNNPINPYFP